ncbi:MAG: aminoglycoside phosphotransferase family protein [Clostridia bacterium]|nr:aminoglycoside phosphotransferase family protein [Clostridia bacterium]
MNFNNIIAKRAKKTIYRDGDYTIKLFDEDYSKSDVLNEALNHARIEETGISIPRLHEVSTHEGKWMLVYDYIEGKTMLELCKNDMAKYDDYLEMFVDLQLDIHSKRSPLLTKLKDKMNRKIELTYLVATTRYELHTRLESMPRHNKICHGDFNPANIIITPEGKPYIIDWAHVTQGNASADVARTYLLFCLKNDKAGGDKYLKLFCKKSDTPLQYVQKWLPIVAASQSVKGKPEERDFLLSWCDVVDYE